MKRFADKAAIVRHPWLQSSSLPYVPSLGDDIRVMTFLVANSIGNRLVDVKKDWCYVPENRHQAATDSLLHCMIYAGVPRTLNAFTQIKQIGVASDGIAALEYGAADYIAKKPHPLYKTPDEARKVYLERGTAEMKILYGPAYDSFRKKLRLLHPAFDRWVVGTIYGRIKSRGILTRQESALVTLAAMCRDAVFPQFRSAMLSAINAGCNLDQIRGVLDQTPLSYGPRGEQVVNAIWADLQTKLSRHKPGGRLEGGGGGGRALQSTDIIWDCTAPKDANYNKACTEATIKAWKEHSREAKAIPTAPILNPRIMRFRKPKSMSEEKLLCCVLSALTCAGNLTGVAQTWTYLGAEHHRMGLEAILQTTIFGGAHNAANALETVHQVGVATSAIDYQHEDSIDLSPVEAHEMGTKFMGLVYGRNLDHLLTNIRGFHPDLEVLIKEFAYGRVLARECPGVTPADRELWSLACMSGLVVFPQLHSHMLGAIKLGATLEEIRCVLDQTELVWGTITQSMIDSYWLEFYKQVNRKKSKPAAPKADKP